MGLEGSQNHCGQLPRPQSWREGMFNGAWTVQEKEGALAFPPSAAASEMCSSFEVDGKVLI